MTEQRNLEMRIFMGTYNDENPNGLASNGWRTVLFDGFNGGSVDRDKWPVLYGGGSGNGGAFQWSNDDVRVGDGELTVSMTNRGGWWSAGGLSQGWEGQTYGRFEVRAKVDQGQGTSGAIVMWPTDNSYPPEVDLLETPEGNRSQAHFTYHWDAGYDAYESHGYNVDTSQWHTYAVDWSPGRLTYYIDGKEMFSTTSNVPQESMALGFMGWVAKDGQNWYNGGPDGSTPGQVNLHVDWAKISVADGGSQGGGNPQPAAVQAEPVPAAVVQEPAPAPAPVEAPQAVDWEALAAQVLANYEATGSWYM